jgi:hypothetical protein
MGDASTVSNIVLLGNLVSAHIAVATKVGDVESKGKWLVSNHRVYACTDSIQSELLLWLDADQASLIFHSFLMEN